MDDCKALVGAFAEGMFPKVEWLRRGTGTRGQASAVRASLTQEIRKLCDALAPECLRPLVSQRATDAAQAIGVVLAEQTWQTQTTFDPGRRVFHLEHVVPVESVRARAIEAASPKDIVRVLQGIRIAWILKEENAELTRLGYRVRRPNPAAAYAEADIVFVAGRTS